MSRVESQGGSGRGAPIKLLSQQYRQMNRAQRRRFCEVLDRVLLRRELVARCVGDQNADTLVRG